LVIVCDVVERIFVNTTMAVGRRRHRSAFVLHAANGYGKIVFNVTLAINGALASGRDQPEP